VQRLTLERVVIDGVPAYVGSQPGSIVAGLTFRVGTADETALDRGVTALVAELAAIDVDGVEFDVGQTLTSFVARGHASAVSDALAAVCRAIPAFDDDDLTQLADTILDDARQPPSLHAALLGLRFGAQTYGTSAITPLGLLRVDGARARAWTTRFFTRANAALWSSGPLAPDVALPLPAGGRVPPPGRPEAECPLPAWCPNAWVGEVFRDAVDCSTTASGSIATSVALRAFAAELVERLDESSLRGTESALRIEAWSDELTYVVVTLATGAHGNDGIECILGCLDDFADLGPDPDELSDAIAELVSWGTDPANAAPIAEMLASDELRTGQPGTHEAFLAAAYDVTAEQVTAEFDRMRNEIMVAVPTDAEIVDPRFLLLEQTTGVALDGTRYRRAEITGGPEDDAQLTVGPDGVTYDRADQLLTVCFEDCVAAVTYPDRTITLFDIDGTTIELSADDWSGGDEAFAAIAAAIPDGVALLARRPFGTPADVDDIDDIDDVDDIEDVDIAGEQL
jgi:zinc protease